MTTSSKNLPDLKDFSAAELQSLIISLLETVARLEARVGLPQSWGSCAD
jgi:hypothetical protein